jgi:hypothetical protein
LQFEELIWEAFPILPLPPAAEWPSDYVLQHESRAFLEGKRWPEVVRWQLVTRAMDSSPSTWIAFMPPAIVSYYLPAALLYAASLVPLDASDFPLNLTEALLLPTTDESESPDEIDEAMANASSLEKQRAARLTLYRSVSREQRRAVGLYLEYFLKFNPSWFDDRGRFFYERNLRSWLDSSR